jgi:hypothetical protein
MGPTFVYENQAPSVEPLGDPYPPGRPQPFISFCRTHRSFFRLKPMRLSSLETVDSLTFTPATFWRNYSPLSGSAAAGGASRSASRSRLPRSSTFGRLPGFFFGASVLPSLSIFA